MVVEPLYIEVADGAMRLRLTAACQGGAPPQIVRVWAVDRPRSSAKLAEFAQIQVEPKCLKPVVKDIPPVGRRSYWLAVVVFSRVGSGWERSISSRHGDCRVPALNLHFLASREFRSEYDIPATVLSIDYAQ